MPKRAAATVISATNVTRTAWRTEASIRGMTRCSSASSSTGGDGMSLRRIEVNPQPHCSQLGAIIAAEAALRL